VLSQLTAPARDVLGVEAADRSPLQHVAPDCIYRPCPPFPGPPLGKTRFARQPRRAGGRAASRRNHRRHHPTGFGSLDKLLGGGLRRRDLILLGGDIGSGKSALALGIALRVAQQSLGVAYLSGEMNEERLMERALAIEGKVAVDELRAAKLNDQTRAGVGGAAVRLRGLPLTLLPLAGEDFETAFRAARSAAAGGARRRRTICSSCRHPRRARHKTRTRRWSYAISRR